MLFDSSVRKELARTFGATLVVILTIVLTMFLIRTIGQAASGAVAPRDVVLLLGYIALGHLPTMLALSLFVAVVLSLGRMYRDSEMSIWFASGVGLSRFVKPVLRAVWPVLLVVGLLLLFAWPWGNRNSLELRERYQQRSDLSRVAPGVFQTSSDGRRVFFVERDAREGDDATAARNVFILHRADHAESVTSARGGRLEQNGADHFLVLERGQRNEANLRTGEHALSSFDTYRVLASERAVREAGARPPRATATLDLVRSPTPRHQGELAWRLGLLFGAANLVLLGVGLAATNPRRASNWNLLFALLAFAIYYNLVNLSQAWVATERVSLAGALLSVHGGAFALALGLLWWRDHAAVMQMPWHRRRTGQAAAAAGV
ncbi:MAG: LPS export ABC transporter permease LptF [Rubrivivax sp.]|nr:LPS export ABC transporter permease LptF [Rubrivivax sp.]